MDNLGCRLDWLWDQLQGELFGIPVRYFFFFNQMIWRGKTHSKCGLLPLVIAQERYGRRKLCLYSSWQDQLSYCCCFCCISHWTWDLYLAFYHEMNMSSSPRTLKAFRPKWELLRYSASWPEQLFLFEAIGFQPIWWDSYCWILQNKSCKPIHNVSSAAPENPD